MGWIADLLQEIPSAARYKSELEAMEKKVTSLEVENVNLRQEIQRRDEVIQKEKSHSDALSQDIEKILVCINRAENITPSQISRSIAIGKSVVEMHLEDLLDLKYICASYTMNQEPEYSLQQQGRKYLHAHRLL